MKESKVGIAILSAFVLTAIAASAENDIKQDPLISPKELVIVPGCISEQIVDEETKTSRVFKRERQCGGETPREEKK